MRVIATIHNDFPTKFGLPRQSSLAGSLLSRIVFEEEFRCPEALRGIDGFSHLWLIWCFSEAPGTRRCFSEAPGGLMRFSEAPGARVRLSEAPGTRGWSPTVRPPRLGGNVRLGVFATRSPNRPNPIGLSCVRLESVDFEKCELLVSGADLCDGTPIFDIKPYLPGVDSKPDARDGFVGSNPYELLAVTYECPLDGLTERQVATLTEVLAQDPRPAYHNDPTRLYHLDYAGGEVTFRVDGNTVKVCNFKK